MPRALVVLCATLAGCGTSRALAPLPEGDFAIQASLPGVFVQSDGAAFPVGTPLLGARYGVAEAVELHADLQLAPLVSGIVGLEGGAVWHVLPAAGWTPGLHLDGTLGVMTKPEQWGEGFSQSVRGGAEVALFAHWEPLAWLWPYVGSENAIIFEDGEYVGSLIAGFQIWPTDTVGFSLETGWAAFNHASDQLTQPYVGIAGHGALSFGVSVEYRGGPLRRSARPEAP